MHLTTGCSPLADAYFYQAFLLFSLTHALPHRYLAQTLQHATRSVYEEVRSAMTHLSKIEKRMEAAEEAMLSGAHNLLFSFTAADVAAEMVQAQEKCVCSCETDTHLIFALLLHFSGDVAAAEEMAQAQEEFAMAGGWDVDKAIADVLSGLGFAQDQVCVCVCVDECLCVSQTYTLFQRAFAIYILLDTPHSTFSSPNCYSFFTVRQKLCGILWWLADAHCSCQAVARTSRAGCCWCWDRRPDDAVSSIRFQLLQVTSQLSWGVC